ncbi:surface antigen [Hoeflea marina]|uniref:Surface antigen n=1 Tax=Hoeflea marina TaxID=274592 RepID=A0A317PPZ9_9HYPH|nr:RT0821/Lpp0805 family surface protein [Hoeflea marina]PWW02229.1 surface antigen [Hoeflea marina]
MTIPRARQAGLTAVLLALAIPAGCSTGPTSVSPLSFGPLGGGVSQNQQSESILAQLNGGVLPPVALGGLPNADRTRALEAEYRALEATPSGQSVAWKSPDGRASGKVTAATPYQVGQQNCRQYSHSAVLNGASVAGQGAACRNEDGSWTPLT